MKVSLVVPVFNEEEAIPHFYSEVCNNIALYRYDIEVVFINDGSTDNTEMVLNKLPKYYKRNDKSVIEGGGTYVNILSFSRNFGKEAALFAGLENATGDVVIPIDVDLQDPIDVIPQLLDKYLEDDDTEIVLAKRIDRSSDSFLKRKTAELFYKVHNKISDIKIEENVGDFRLLSRVAVDAIKQLPERKLFMKGVLSWVGFKTAIVEYTREERVAGKTKFNGWKLWNLALEGITSFSTVPLRLWTYLGLFIAVVSFSYSIYLIVDKLVYGNDVPGYPSLMCTILFLGGIQLVGIGVLGEYIGRIYVETKDRPRYIIKNRINSGDEHVELSKKYEL